MVEANDVAVVAADIDAILRQLKPVTQRITRDWLKPTYDARRGANHYRAPFPQTTALDCLDYFHFASRDRTKAAFSCQAPGDRNERGNPSWPCRRVIP